MRSFDKQTLRKYEKSVSAALIVHVDTHHVRNRASSNVIDTLYTVSKLKR